MLEGAARKRGGGGGCGGFASNEGHGVRLALLRRSIPLQVHGSRGHRGIGTVTITQVIIVDHKITQVILIVVLVTIVRHGCIPPKQIHFLNLEQEVQVLWTILSTRRNSGTVR